MFFGTTSETYTKLTKDKVITSGIGCGNTRLNDTLTVSIGAYTYDVEYEEGVDVELTEFLEFTEGEYRWYMDRETTKTALLKTYDEYFEEYEITEEDIIEAGYKSFEDCKTQWLEEDLEYIVDDYNEEEGGKGTWQINQGEFTFIEEGTSAEFITDYKIEDGKLYLQTDGLVLTKVK